MLTYADVCGATLYLPLHLSLTSLPRLLSLAERGEEAAAGRGRGSCHALGGYLLASLYRSPRRPTGKCASRGAQVCVLRMLTNADAR
jgi:hypothetical protein